MGDANLAKTKTNQLAEQCLKAIGDDTLKLAALYADAPNLDDEFYNRLESIIFHHMSKMGNPRKAYKALSLKLHPDKIQPGFLDFDKLEVKAKELDITDPKLFRTKEIVETLVQTKDLFFKLLSEINSAGSGFQAKHSYDEIFEKLSSPKSKHKINLREYYQQYYSEDDSDDEPDTGYGHRRSYGYNYFYDDEEDPRHTQGNRAPNYRKRAPKTESAPPKPIDHFNEILIAISSKNIIKTIDHIFSVDLLKLIDHLVKNKLYVDLVFLSEQVRFRQLLKANIQKIAENILVLDDLTALEIIFDSQDQIAEIYFNFISSHDAVRAKKLLQILAGTYRVHAVFDKIFAEQVKELSEDSLALFKNLISNGCLDIIKLSELTREEVQKLSHPLLIKLIINEKLTLDAAIQNFEKLSEIYSIPGFLDYMMLVKDEVAAIEKFLPLVDIILKSDLKYYLAKRKSIDEKDNFLNLLQFVLAQSPDILSRCYHPAFELVLSNHIELKQYLQHNIELLDRLKHPISQIYFDCLRAHSRVSIPDFYTIDVRDLDNLYYLSRIIKADKMVKQTRAVYSGLFDDYFKLSIKERSKFDCINQYTAFIVSRYEAIVKAQLEHGSSIKHFKFSNDPFSLNTDQLKNLSTLKAAEFVDEYELFAYNCLLEFEPEFFTKHQHLDNHALLEKCLLQTAKSANTELLASFIEGANDSSHPLPALNGQARILKVWTLQNKHGESLCEVANRKGSEHRSKLFTAYINHKTTYYDTFSNGAKKAHRAVSMVLGGLMA